jgi:hypothetical protein
MRRATKPGVIDYPDFNRIDIRTWERAEGIDGYRIGIWQRDETAERWFIIKAPPYPWRHREGVLLAFLHPDGRSVLVSGSVQLDERPWLHVSVARQNRMPSYKDLAEVKELFIGPAYQTIQVFPPETNRVNLHPYALHLWTCLQDDGLPDFTRGGASI